MRGETWSAKFYLKQNREESKEQTDLRVCPLQLWRWVRLLRVCGPRTYGPWALLLRSRRWLHLPVTKVRPGNWE